MKTLGTGGTPPQIKTAVKILNEFIADEVGFKRNLGKGKQISPFYYPGTQRLTSGDFHEIQSLRKVAIEFLDSKGIFSKFDVSFKMVPGVAAAASRLIVELPQGEIYPSLQATFRDIELAEFFAIAFLIRYLETDLQKKEGYLMTFETAVKFYNLEQK